VIIIALLMMKVLIGEGEEMVVIRMKTSGHCSSIP
jgi:hypothetical protein